MPPLWGAGAARRYRVHGLRLGSARGVSRPAEGSAGRPGCVIALDSRSAVDDATPDGDVPYGSSWRAGKSGRLSEPTVPALIDTSRVLRA